MQWLRLRPESPEELDMVDWKGRWIDEDDEEDYEEEDDDRQMEDFDPDGEDDEEEEDEQEEEEDQDAPMHGQQPSGSKTRAPSDADYSRKQSLTISIPSLSNAGNLTSTQLFYTAASISSLSAEGPVKISHWIPKIATAVLC